MSKSAIWEKCARLLLLNNATEIVDFVETIEKIINNIMLNPDEDKFKVLKAANKLVKTKILDRSGGMEFLFAIGFVSETDTEGAKLLKLTDTNLLASGLEWLRNTATVCYDFAVAKGDKASSNCCECVIQVRLPTGQSVSGGFMKGDLLQDVKEFVLSYFQESRASQIQIMIPPSTRSATDEELLLSLEQLGMFPRAIVIASTLSDVDKSLSLEKVR